MKIESGIGATGRMRYWEAMIPIPIARDAPNWLPPVTVILISTTNILINMVLLLASARAGNVIGGGDWAQNRLIPDCIDALTHHRNMVIRNPEAVRPWQHVLEPLRGYLMLAERLYEKGPEFAEAWNFGPDDHDVKKVEWIVRKLMKDWGTDVTLKVHQEITLHEAQYLKLDCSKAKTRLNWHPIWNVQTALSKIVEWNKAYIEKKDMKDITLNQIKEYMENR